MATTAATRPASHASSSLFPAPSREMLSSSMSLHAALFFPATSAIVLPSTGHANASAEAASSAREHSSLPATHAARKSADLPALSTRMTSHRSFSSMFTTASCPPAHASIKGVTPSSSVASIAAPLRRSMVAMASNPSWAAMWRAVKPSSSACRASAPSSRHRFTPASSPPSIASMSSSPLAIVPFVMSVVCKFSPGQTVTVMSHNTDCELLMVNSRLLLYK